MRNTKCSERIQKRKLTLAKTEIKSRMVTITEVVSRFPKMVKGKKPPFLLST